MIAGGAASTRLPPARRAASSSSAPLRRDGASAAQSRSGSGWPISSAVALILAVTAEIVIGSAGLGREINIARSSGAIELMYALIITTGLLGWLLNTATTRAERRVLHWHPSQRGLA